MTTYYYIIDAGIAPTWVRVDGTLTTAKRRATADAKRQYLDGKRITVADRIGGTYMPIAVRRHTRTRMVWTTTSYGACR